ncbi:hypothetical protein HYV82_04840 [Candidatus Woesearchaeota archaeon]|nr:hypothetical protein [Candidatus Woesearchaeota archaeon]
MSRELKETLERVRDALRVMYSFQRGFVVKKFPDDWHQNNNFLQEFGRFRSLIGNNRITAICIGENIGELRSLAERFVQAAGILCRIDIGRYNERPSFSKLDVKPESVSGAQLKRYFDILKAIIEEFLKVYAERRYDF